MNPTSASNEDYPGLPVVPAVEEIIPSVGLDGEAPAPGRIGSLALHRVAEYLMGQMDAAKARGDYRMAAAFAQVAADAESRAFNEIPRERVRTRALIWESQLSLVAATLKYLAKLPD